MAPRAGSSVDLLGVVGVLHEYLTPGLCAGVFDDIRDTERRRLWTFIPHISASRSPPSFSITRQRVAV
jgi:hypothetical protein